MNTSPATSPTTAALALELGRKLAAGEPILRSERDAYRAAKAADAAAAARR